MVAVGLMFTFARVKKRMERATMDAIAGVQPRMGAITRNMSVFVMAAWSHLCVTASSLVLVHDVTLLYEQRSMPAGRSYSFLYEQCWPFVFEIKNFVRLK